MSLSDPVAPARRSQTERRGQAQQALQAAALHLFAQRGVENTSLADIGQHAGYSRGLVNHHFGSKAALVEQLATDAQRIFGEALRARLAVDDEVGILLASVDLYLGLLVDPRPDPRAFFVMLGSALAEDSPLREIFSEGDARFRAGVESVARRGQERGTIAKGLDPAGFAAAVVALLRGIGAQYFVNPAGLDLDAARRSCAALIQAAVRTERNQR